MAKPEDKHDPTRLLGRLYLQRYKILTLSGLIVILIVGYIFRIQIWEKIVEYFLILSDREQIKSFINSYGAGAPIVFIIIQILQVLFAPVPGEATGFIGGFLFGPIKGFVFSSIGLSIGSCLNFVVGRFLGERYIRKLIPDHYLNRFDTFLKRQGVIVIFILFLFPGFPKDYLCLFLGLSTLPFKVFIILATIGRMPATFVLSLQGAYLFEKNYLVFTIVFGLCIILGLLAYRYKAGLYKWLEKFNNE
ncbi:MAG: TVP38/TMEM64 family protein [Desulfobacterales bacterium]|nr:TVP38/TMEM64 family protein [Deltaproteobacteria bacterium]NNL43720.1 TVP38/TMEM64 family protein [Desulfobacterales bacterium]